MPDVTVSIAAEDDVTPALNKVKGTINDLTQSTAALVEEGRLLSQGFERAGIAIANAMRLGTAEQKAAMQAYQASQKAPGGTPLGGIYGGMPAWPPVLGGGGPGGGAPGGSYIRQVPPQMQPMMVPPGGGGGGIGGMVSEMGGLAGEMAKMGETFLKWGIAWQVLEAGLKGIEAGIGQVVGAFQVYGQLSNTLGADNEALGSTFTGLTETAIMTGTSIQETGKHFQEFLAYGFDADEAVRATETVQLAIKQIGVDLTQAYAKANVLGASIQDLQTVGAAGNEEARQEAVRQLREENTRKYIQFEMQQRQQAEGYALSDSNRAVAEYTEAHQRAVSEEMEDRHRATRQDLDEQLHSIHQEREASKRAIAEEMEDQHRAAEEQMADQHRAAEEKMADQHRAAAEAEADIDRLHNRQLGAATGVKGLLGAAVRGGGLPSELEGYGLENALEKLKGQLETGYTQFAKDLGITADAAKELTQRGLVSPEEILREAQVPREEARIAAERGRAKEEREGGRGRATEEREAGRGRGAEEREYRRAQQKEDVAQDEMDYQARKQMNKALGDEERTVHRELAADRLKIEKEIADSERELTRRNAKDRDEITKQRLIDELHNQEIIANDEIARAKATAQTVNEIWKEALESTGVPFGEEPKPAGAPSGEAPASEGTLQKIQQTLAQLLSGG